MREPDDPRAACAEAERHLLQRAKRRVELREVVRARDLRTAGAGAAVGSRRQGDVIVAEIVGPILGDDRGFGCGDGSDHENGNCHNPEHVFPQCF
jgi:hypothetical protein